MAPWNLLEKQILRPHLRPTTSETWGKAQKCVLRSLLADCDATSSVTPPPVRLPPEGKEEPWTGYKQAGWCVRSERHRIEITGLHWAVPEGLVKAPI